MLHKNVAFITTILSRPLPESTDKILKLSHGGSQILLFTAIAILHDLTAELEKLDEDFASRMAHATNKTSDNWKLTDIDISLSKQE